jgi:hypothetical protein
LPGGEPDDQDAREDERGEQDAVHQSPHMTSSGMKNDTTTIAIGPVQLFVIEAIAAMTAARANQT